MLKHLNLNVLLRYTTDYVTTATTATAAAATSLFKESDRALDQLALVKPINLAATANARSKTW